MRRVLVVALAASAVVGLVAYAATADAPETGSSGLSVPSSPAPSPSVYRTPVKRPADLFVPSPLITPGTVLTTNPADFCTPGWSAAHREGLTVRQKRYVLERYGLPQDVDVSEWDHLVSLQLGGANGVENIWPQLDRAQDQRKDRLESALHRAVCDRREMSAEEAQRRIRIFWLYW